MAKETLTVEIRTEVQQAVKDLRKYTDAVKQNTKQLEKTREKTGALTKAVKAYFAEITAVILAVKKIAKVVKSLTDEYIEQERAEALLNSTLKATGIWTQTLSDQLITYGEEMQKVTTYSKAQTWEAQGILATFTQIGTQAYPEVIERAMDMSAVFGQDLQQSIIQLGKAINDPRLAEGLRRIGISMSEEQVKMIDNFLEMGDIWSAQRVILDELQIEIGGAAKAMGETFGGQVEIAKNLVDEWKGAIGELLAEQGQPFIEWLIAFLQNAENLQKVTKIIKGILTYMATWFGFMLNYYGVIVKAIQALINVYKNLGKVISIVFNPKEWGKGEMKAALADIKDTVVETTVDIIDGFKEWGAKAKESFSEIFGPDIQEQMETVGWIAQTAMDKSAEATRNNTEAIKENKEEIIEWSSNWEVMRAGYIDAITQMIEIETRHNEIMAEAIEYGSGYAETMGLLSEQIVDTTSNLEEMANRQKEHDAMVQETINKSLPLWSQYFTDIGDKTTTFKDLMKDMFAKILRMFGEEMFAMGMKALIPWPPWNFHPGAAAVAFAGSAAAFAASGAIKSLAKGGQFVTQGPELIMVGDNPGGRERVTVEPMGTQNINNNLTMPLTIQFGSQTITRELQYQFDSGKIAVPQRVVI